MLDYDLFAIRNFAAGNAATARSTPPDGVHGSCYRLLQQVCGLPRDDGGLACCP
jgi:hypothetical protein